MKLTKQLKEEILRDYHAYWGAYLRGDMKTFASYLDEQVQTIGTAASEVFRNKREALRFYKATADQMTGKAELRNQKVGIQSVPGGVLTTEESDLYVKTGKHWVLYGPTRVTALLYRGPRTWMVLHQHASFPDRLADAGEQIGTEKLKTENRELREAVQRRTHELEVKNRELEIDTSLERVRTVAMSMKRPDDMLGICRTIAEELRKLGLKEIRNVQTAIFYPERGTYMNYEFYQKHNKTFITEVDYKNHRVQLSFARKMMKGRGQSVVEQFRGKQLKDWYAYQKTTNQFADNYLLTAASLNYYWYSLGPVALGLSTYTAWSKEELALFQRFLKVFELAYRRYLDIEKAEAQAREARMEAALERIRARALAMHHSEELLEVAKVMREQLDKLGQPELETAAIQFYHQDPEHIVSWRAFRISSSKQADISYNRMLIPRGSCAFVKEMEKKFKAREQQYTLKLEGAVQREWYKILFRLAPEIGPAMRKSGQERAVRYYHFSKFRGGVLLLVSAVEPSAASIDLQRRAAAVFNLAYRRFEDLKKAEAQAREAQIEASLERVRAAAMAMRNSVEIRTVINLVYSELTQLDAKLDRCFFMIVNPENNGITWWMGGPEGLLNENGFFVQNNPHPSHQLYLSHSRKRTRKWSYLFEGKEKRDWDRFGFGKTELNKLPEPVKNYMSGVKRVYLHGSSDRFGSLITGSLGPLPDEQHEIICRFAGVFSQTYTRFLDLQKAEAQAREAQKEASLEKVRARSMAMQQPEELIEVAELLRREMGHLGVEELETSSIYIVDTGSKRAECWYAIKDVRGEDTKLVRDELSLQLTDTWVGKEMWKFFRSEKEQVSIVMKGERRKEWINYCAERSKVLKGYYGDTIPERTYHLVKFNGGYMGAATPGAISPESVDLLKRVAAVFSLAYTRFRDLQDAAARAREAQIELALERVRARTMAMHRSDELKEVIRVVLEQFSHLNILVEHAGFYIDYKANDDMHIWLADPNIEPFFAVLPYFDSPTWHSFIAAKSAGKSFYTDLLDFNAKNKFYRSLFKLFTVPEEAQRFYLACKGLAVSTVLLENVGLYIENFSAIPYSEEENEILMRFGKVFQQTYTRFLDLQKAEAQAREAQIEVALERVRSKSMAMHRSGELAGVVAVLYKQFEELGFGLYQILVSIFDESARNIEWWSRGFGEVDLPQCNHIPLIDHPHPQEQLKAWKKGLEYRPHVLEGKQKKSWEDYLFTQTELKRFPDAVKKQMRSLDRVFLSDAYMKYGVLQAAGPEHLPDDKARILVRFARVLDQAYTRMKDLQQAEEQAREAKIEASLERIRAKVTAMKESSELFDIVVSMRREFIALGHEADYFWHMRWGPENYELSMTSDDGSRLGMVIHVPRFVHEEIPDLYNWEKGNSPVCVLPLNADQAWNYVDKMNTYGSFEQIDPHAPTEEDIRHIGGITFIIARTTHGEIGFSLAGEVPDPPKESLETLIRFAGVFDLAYRRFEDLKEAERRNRETQIELALERVRARTMAMQKSTELFDAANVMFQQIEALGTVSWNCGFNIWEADRKFATSWNGAKGGVMVDFRTNSAEDVFKRFYEAAERGETFYVEALDREACAAHYRYMATIPKVGELFREMANAGVSLPEQQIFHIAYFSQGYLMFITYEPVPHLWDIFQRFARVFEQTYTRFLDLQKAEAQARESEIQLALERVRARSLAMHQTSELQDVVNEVAQQLVQMKIDMDGGLFIVINDEVEKDIPLWGAAGAADYVSKSTVPYFDQPVYTRMLTAIRKREPFLAERFSMEEKNAFLQHMFRFPPWSGTSQQRKEELLARAGGYCRSVAISRHTSIGMTNHHGKAFSEEENTILRRFGNVLEQSYTRFLDLQKAEAQAREAQIEASLERVRARSMAMHSSTELSDVASVMFDQMKLLGSELFAFGIVLCDKHEHAVEQWHSLGEGGMLTPFHVPIDLDYIHRYRYDQWKTGAETFSIEIPSDYIARHFELMFELPSVRVVMDDLASKGVAVTPPSWEIDYGASFRNGYLLVSSLKPFAEEKIFARFARVFEQAYTRFLDLQKAEAQAREAQIQLGLERVRARTLAMQRQQDLFDVVSTFGEQLVSLGLKVDYVSFIDGIISKDRDWDLWGCNPNLTFPAENNLIPYKRTAYFTRTAESVERYERTGNPIQVKTFTREEKDEFFDHYFLYAAPVPDAFKQYLYDAPGSVIVDAFVNEVTVSLCRYDLEPYTPEQLDIFKRFSNEFRQAYIRFLDLKKAETQAREAQIEAALERVRSRTLAMQRSDELADTSAELFRQLIGLGISPNRLYITIIKDNGPEAEWWITDEDGSKMSLAYQANLDEVPAFVSMLEGWKRQEESRVIAMEGEELQAYFRYLISKDVPFRGGLEQTRRVQHLAYFSKGFIGMASPEEQPKETLELLKRFASVFNLTYTRFNDLQMAEAAARQAEQDLIEIKSAREKAEAALSELQATQRQLIQSEKMASLGELTAGIAHEIQNPLNFVNNFSEVSKELLDEMKQELEKGDVELAKEIMQDVIQNLEKINHHGKRADGIVKGMLQHSRSSSGQKEPTDINALCDEYLRLAYHGLRAKDKSFNAKFETELDPAVGMVSVLPQEMGRVILNLINNAFYAVNERKKTADPAYEPCVTVSTRKTAGKVEIQVRDNGTGIPQKVIDKIFQPFFTTKPTGEGTGLGLSLSYDIIKAHGGEVRVETKENQGSIFIIQLPT